MNSKKIKEILNTFVNDTDYKSILIDGPWGCGKTFEITEFIKNSKAKIYYLSLFGLESIDEINTALYQSIHKVKSALKNGVTLISKAIKVFPYADGVGEALDYQLGNIKDSIKNNVIIVFDDLERVTTKIDFTDLLGYINSLFLSKCRIVCLMSSENLEDDKRQEFDKFKEKVFDCTYVINETNEGVLREIFKEYDIDGVELSFPLFENNLRMAKKAELFFKEIVNIIKSRDIDINYLDISPLLLLKSCIYTVMICLKSFSKPMFKEDKENSYYEYDKKIFGENVANGFYFYFSDVSKDYEKRIIKNIVMKMIPIFMYKDDKSFCECFFPPKNEAKENILDKSFYYLSDKNKREYCVAFEKFVNSRKFDIKDIKDKLISILKYTDYTISNQTIIDIASKYIEENNDDFFMIDFYFVGEEDECDEKTRKKIDSIKEKLKKEIVIQVKNKLLSDIHELGANNKYDKFSVLIEKQLYNSKESFSEIATKLIDNNFYLPNLSEDISEKEWHFAHLMAKYSCKLKIGSKFIEVAKKTCKKEKSNNSLIDRYFSLIYYNIDKSFNKNDLLN